MRFFLEKIEALKAGWNQRPLAAVALIPRTWLETRTTFEIATEEGIGPETVAERFQIFKDRGI
jgi:hypothetical protein